MQNEHSLSQRVGAEVLGTFWIVLGGCGSAALSALFPFVGIGMLGVALAFGASLAAMAFAFCRVSGAHFNPAVTLALVVARRFPARDMAPYWIGQVLGGILAAAVLYLIARGAPTFEPGTFAANGYAQHSPGGYELGSAFLAELVMTFGLAMVVLGSTRSLGRFAPLAIGLCYALVHWVTLPVTRTSVNPARSTGPALLAGDWALGQLWLFWLAPLIGAVLAGAIYPLIARAPRSATGRPRAAQEAPLSRDFAQPTT